MSIFVWENGVAQPWQAFQGVSITNYITSQVAVTNADILTKICTVQGLVLISGDKLALIFKCLTSLKKGALEDKNFLYSAIKDLQRDLLRSDREIIAKENRGEKNADRR